MSCDLVMSFDVVPGGLSTDLKERVMLSQNNVVKNIADVLLQRVRIEGGVVYKLLCRNMVNSLLKSL